MSSRRQRSIPLGGRYRQVCSLPNMSWQHADSYLFAPRCTCRKPYDPPIPWCGLSLLQSYCSEVAFCQQVDPPTGVGVPRLQIPNINLPSINMYTRSAAIWLMCHVSCYWQFMNTLITVLEEQLLRTTQITKNDQNSTNCSIVTSRHITATYPAVRYLST